MDILSFKIIIDKLSEGIVVIDKNRKVYYINALAQEMTGWDIGESVPYCSYCKMREVPFGEERCILAQDDPLPSFQAHMPTYRGKKDVSFEMSSTKVTLVDGKTYMILILRNPNWTSEKQQLKIKKLLVRDSMATQERERKSIARELHDHIGQSVYSAFLGLQGLKHRITEEDYRNHFDNIEKTLYTTLNDIKRLTKDLRPQAIDMFGLESALQSVIVEWESLYDIEIKLQYEAELPQLSNEISLHLFRFVQEAVRNAVKHGKAKQIQIIFTLKRNLMMFEIIDNGSGFDVYSIKAEGLGLYHMKERIDMINGEVNWFSKIGGPTKVKGTIPLKKAGGSSEGIIS